mgnify:FL=1
MIASLAHVRMVLRIRHALILSQSALHSHSLHQAHLVVQEVVVASVAHILAVEAAALVAHAVPSVVIDSILDNECLINKEYQK